MLGESLAKHCWHHSGLRSVHGLAEPHYYLLFRGALGLSYRWRDLLPYWNYSWNLALASVTWRLSNRKACQSVAVMAYHDAIQNASLEMTGTSMAKNSCLVSLVGRP